MSVALNVKRADLGPSEATGVRLTVTLDEAAAMQTTLVTMDPPSRVNAVEVQPVNVAHASTVIAPPSPPLS